MFTTFIALFLFLIFLFLSAIHFYWGFGGKWGASASVPAKENLERVMNPKALDCFIVGIGLLAAGLFVLIRTRLILFPLPSVILHYGLIVISGIFILRAIGEFNYIGFFKKIKNTPFGQLDTRYYSPLCLFIGLMALILEQYTP
jgi:hypothetical protein